jgi:hypothetical protein
MKKLPLTKQVLANHLETWEDFMLRKIDWAKNIFVEQKKTPNLTELRRLAGALSRSSYNSKRVHEALHNTITEITKVVTAKFNR